MTETVNYATGEIVDTINYEVHPVAALFPFIDGDAFREFVEDIRVNGQREPVVLDDAGRLIDGRNRARACQALGIDVKESTYSGDDVEAWIVSHNVHRRHLTTSQRSMIAARLATLKAGNPTGANQHSGGKGSKEPFPHLATKSQNSAPSIVDAASQLSVARESVKRARSVIESGDEDLIKAVESGEKTVTAAAREIRKPAEKPKAPPRHGPRRKHDQILAVVIDQQLDGICLGLAEITELDQSLTDEEAARLTDGLSKHIRSLNRIKTLLKERTK